MGNVLHKTLALRVYKVVPHRRVNAKGSLGMWSLSERSSDLAAVWKGWKEDETGAERPHRGLD